MKKLLVNKVFLFNALAIVVAIATQFGYTGDVTTADTEIIVGATAIIDLIIMIVKKIKKKKQ